MRHGSRLGGDPGKEDGGCDARHTADSFIRRAIAPKGEMLTRTHGKRSKRKTGETFEHPGRDRNKAEYIYADKSILTYSKDVSQKSSWNAMVWSDSVRCVVK